MKRNDYHIKISFDKESLLVEDCKDVPYLNSRGRGDIFKFHPHDITIETNRLPVYQKDDVLTNTSNSIYQQISKALRGTRQTLWRAVQMLTQKLCCQTIHDCPKVVPLHYESEWQ